MCFDLRLRISHELSALSLLHRAAAPIIPRDLAEISAIQSVAIAC